MNEVLPLYAVAMVILGAVISVAQGYGNRPENETFKFGRFGSSLIIAVLGALSVSTLANSFISDQITELGYVAFGVLYLLQGYGTDKGLSKLDK